MHQSSNLHLSLQIEDTLSSQLDAVIDETANHLSSALRSLESAKVLLAQPLCPIRRQHAVSCASHRVFRDALRRSEVAADEVIISFARGGHNYAWPSNPGECCHVRCQFP